MTWSKGGKGRGGSDTFIHKSIQTEEQLNLCEWPRGSKKGRKKARESAIESGSCN